MKYYSALTLTLLGKLPIEDVEAGIISAGDIVWRNPGGDMIIAPPAGRARTLGAALAEYHKIGVVAEYTPTGAFKEHTPRRWGE